MRPFSVDANAIAKFQHERISQNPGEGSQAVNAILADNCIALDEEKLCLQEWMDSAAGTFPFALTDWIISLIPVGKIRYFGLAPNTCRKMLVNAGLPTKDHKWVRLALGSGGKIIVSGDIDFFEPAQKKAKADAKAKIKKCGSGSCSKALIKHFGVEVVCTDAVEAYLA